MGCDIDQVTVIKKSFESLVQSTEGDSNLEFSNIVDRRTTMRSSRLDVTRDDDSWFEVDFIKIKYIPLHLFPT